MTYVAESRCNGLNVRHLSPVQYSKRHSGQDIRETVSYVISLHEKWFGNRLQTNRTRRSVLREVQGSKRCCYNKLIKPTNHPPLPPTLFRPIIMIYGVGSIPVLVGTGAKQ
jgi:hypothetical protein